MAHEGKDGPLDQDQNLPPTPLSRAQQLEQWQAQKRTSMDSSKKVRGTPVKGAFLSSTTGIQGGTPVAKLSAKESTAAAGESTKDGTPLGVNSGLVNSASHGTQSTPQTDRTAKYLHNASARPSGILSPVRMGPQRTPSKVGQVATMPKAARVQLPAQAEVAKSARVPLPRTPMPVKGFKAPAFSQKKGASQEEWRKVQAGAKAPMTGPLEVIAGKVAVLKGSLTPQRKGAQKGHADSLVPQPANPHPRSSRGDGKAGSIDLQQSGRGHAASKSQSAAPKNGAMAVDSKRALHASYWLGRIREAESHGNHGMVISLFEEAVESNAQPAAQLVRALQQYRAKHMGGRTAKAPSQAPRSEAALPKGQSSKQPSASETTKQIERKEVASLGEQSRSRAEGPERGAGVDAMTQSAAEGLETSLESKSGVSACEDTPGVEKSASDGKMAPTVGNNESPPVTPSATVLVTPVSPSGRGAQVKAGSPMVVSPPVQEEEEEREMQVYLTPVCQQGAKLESLSQPGGATADQTPDGDVQQDGDVSPQLADPTSLPIHNTPTLDSPTSDTSPATDKTDEPLPLPPYSSPTDTFPSEGGSPTTLVPQTWVNPNPAQTPKPRPHSPAGSPTSFLRRPSSAKIPARTGSIELNPSSSMSQTPETPRLKTAVRLVGSVHADVMRTPAVTPLVWHAASDVRGQSEMSPGPGQSTPAAIQMPSVQRSASRVTPDVIRTPGLSRKLNLDGDDSSRTPGGRTPLSRFALKSPARRVPLFGGLEELTSVKASEPRTRATEESGVKGSDGEAATVRLEKLTPVKASEPRTRATEESGVKGSGGEAATVKETEPKGGADPNGMLSPGLAQIADFPVVLKGKKSLKPSPLNLRDASSKASPAKGRRSSSGKEQSPTAVEEMPAVNQEREGVVVSDKETGIDQSQENNFDQPEGGHAALDGILRMFAYVASETVSQQNAERQVASKVDSVGTASGGKRRGLVRGGSPGSSKGVGGAGQGLKKGGASEVERWLRKAHGKDGDTVASEPQATQAVGSVNNLGKGVDQSDVDFPAVEDGGVSAGAERISELVAGVNTLPSGRKKGTSRRSSFGNRVRGKDAQTERASLGAKTPGNPDASMPERKLETGSAAHSAGVKMPSGGVKTLGSGTKGTPMLRQERARLPQLVIDNSKRTPVAARNPIRRQSFNSLLNTPEHVRPSPLPETLTPGAATADEWAAAADRIHQNQMVAPPPPAFGSPLSTASDTPPKEAGSSPQTPPPLPELPDQPHQNPPQSLESAFDRASPLPPQLSPRVIAPARQLSSRFTPSRLSQPPAAQVTFPVTPPSQRKAQVEGQVSGFAVNRELTSLGRALGSPAQRTPGVNGGRSAVKTGTRELRQLSGAPNLLGQGAHGPAPVTTILSPVRATKQDRQALGADRFVLSPVRRSGRKPAGDGTLRQSNNEVHELLEKTGFVYIPNKALSAPSSARKTPAARRIAQLTSGGSSPELAVLETATCPEEEHATWQQPSSDGQLEREACKEAEEEVGGGQLEQKEETDDVIAAGGTEEIENGLAKGDSEEEKVEKEGTVAEKESSERRAALQQPGQGALNESVNGHLSGEALSVAEEVLDAPIENAVHTAEVHKEAWAAGSSDDVAVHNPEAELGMIDGVNTLEASQPVEGSRAAVYTRRATRRSVAGVAQDAPPLKATDVAKKLGAIRETSTEGQEGFSRRKGAESRNSLAVKEAAIADSKSVSGADSKRETAADPAGGIVVAESRRVEKPPRAEDLGVFTPEEGGEHEKASAEAARVEKRGAGLSDGEGLTTENSSEGRSGRRAVWRKKVSFATQAEAEEGSPAKLVGEDLTSKVLGTPKRKKGTARPKRVSFAPSANPEDENEGALEKEYSGPKIRASARRRSMGRGLASGAADVSTGAGGKGDAEVNEGLLGAAGEENADVSAETGAGAGRAGKRPKGRSMGRSGKRQDAGARQADEEENVGNADGGNEPEVPNFTRGLRASEAEQLIGQDGGPTILKASARKGRVRRTARSVAEVEQEPESEDIDSVANPVSKSQSTVSEASNPVSNSVLEATPAKEESRGRTSRRTRAAVSDGEPTEGATSARRTRGRRVAGQESAESGDGAVSKEGASKGSRGRKSAAKKAGADMGKETFEQNQGDCLPLAGVEERSGRKSARGVSTSAAPTSPIQAGSDRITKAVVGRGRRGVLGDSTNVQNPNPGPNPSPNPGPNPTPSQTPKDAGAAVETKKAIGARVRTTVKGSGIVDADSADNVNGAVEDNREMVAVGTRIQVWWPDDKRYYSGVVKEYKARSGKHKVEYDDGDSEDLLLTKETWRLEKGRPAKRAGAGRAR